MIKLEVQPYCSDCRDFEADVVKPERVITACGDFVQGSTIVRCENARRCEAIKRYLEKQKSES